MTEVNPLLQFYRDIKPTLVSGIWFGKSIKEINNLDPAHVYLNHPRNLRTFCQLCS